MTMSPFIAGLAKAVAVGALMAGGAGGVYFVSRTNEDGGDRQVVAETPTAPSAETGTPTPSAPTPIVGLTASGFTAPDGAPLYLECIGTNPLTGAKFTLPPVYPTRSPPTTPEPTPEPRRLPDFTPEPSQLPPFAFSDVAAATSTSLTLHTSPCYGLTLSAPTRWVMDPASFGSFGYQQETGAIFYDEQIGLKVQLGYTYQPGHDSIEASRHPGDSRSFGNGSYLVIKDEPVTVAGGAGIMYLALDTTFGDYMALAYIVRIKPDWYLAIHVNFQPPYNEQAFAEVKALIASIVVAP